MEQRGRVLAVDYGRVRVGLAVSDPLGHTAQPLRVVQRSPKGSLLEAVVAAVREVDAIEIVVGLPLKLDGGEGVNAQATRSFASELGERTRLPVTLFDERFSTTMASRGMRDAGVSAREQRGVVDKVAAALILQAFLDGRRPPVSADPDWVDAMGAIPLPARGRGRGKHRR